MTAWITNVTQLLLGVKTSKLSGSEEKKSLLLFVKLIAVRKNAVTLKDAIELMVNEFKLRRGLNESRIREQWSTVMGAMIARNTTDISLRKGKLYLKIESAALKHELTYSKEKIKEIFNKELGDNVITDVLIF